MRYPARAPDPGAGTGDELVVWLTDIAGISREEAADLLRWSANALLQSALSEEAPTAPAAV